MNNEYTELIKDKMKDFQQYYLNSNEEKIVFCVSDSEINPHLLGYIFDKILNFDVKYRIFEKINYIITFKYKGKIGRIIHAKLSFKFYLKKEIEEEVKFILFEVIDLLEKALLKYSESAVKVNDYSLPNFNHYYVKKISVIEEDIRKIIIEKEKVEKNFQYKEEELVNSGEAYKQIIVKKSAKYSLIETPLQRLDDKYSLKKEKLKIKLSYLIELYIDNYFSYIEHILCLLYPMTNNYNENEEFAKYLGFDWAAKLNKINNDKSFNEIISKLSEIKEIYRNRFAHGLFSREKFVNVMINGFGSYPLWIGKKYCQGYKGTSNLLTTNEYNQSKEIFADLMSILIEKYSLQWNIINANIPTFLKRKFYEDALINEEKNEYWINKYWYYQDNLLNMDW